MVSRRTLIAAFLAAPAAYAQTESSFAEKAARAAEAMTLNPEIYDPTYVPIAYPMGDVPADHGVCADVIVRAFRAGGVDLQQSVHEDMARAFSAYPKIWGLNRPDANIDHRRVPNLETFFARAGAELALTTHATLYQAGDLVSWRIPVPHIGIVSTKRAASGRPLMVHNIGAGSQLEDVLFAWPRTGWFRYRPVTETR